MILYALTSARAPGRIDVFLDREDAEAALVDILRDEPDFTSVVHIEEFEVGEPVRVDTTSLTLLGAPVDDPLPSAHEGE